MLLIQLKVTDRVINHASGYIENHSPHSGIDFHLLPYKIAGFEKYLVLDKSQDPQEDIRFSNRKSLLLYLYFFPDSLAFPNDSKKPEDGYELRLIVPVDVVARDPSGFYISFPLHEQHIVHLKL